MERINKRNVGFILAPPLGNFWALREGAPLAAAGDSLSPLRPGPSFGTIRMENKRAFLRKGPPSMGGTARDEACRACPPSPRFATRAQQWPWVVVRAVLRRALAV